ncbi:MAG: hypothetical protein HY344_00940 [Candidatus Levybacteria bacterium]|nr:hypothetical protein [Candidatus Levybacteria bacterium]
MPRREGVNRGRQFAEALAATAIVATTVGVAAVKYNDAEAQARRDTVQATLTPGLIAEAARTIHFSPLEIENEQATLAKYAFDPLPEGQIQNHRELVRETKDRIDKTLQFMAESQNPVFKSAVHFLQLYGESNTVIVTPVDSLPKEKSPMYAPGALSEDGLGFAIIVSRDDSVYKLGLVGMALEITGQVEGIRHNMEHVQTITGDIEDIGVRQVEYIVDQTTKAQRAHREDGAIAEALLTQIELGYDGIVNADLQTKSKRFLELNGNLFIK